MLRQSTVRLAVAWRLLLVLLLGGVGLATVLLSGGWAVPAAILAEEPPLVVPLDFAGGELLGLERAPDGTLVLSAAELPTGARPRAYVDHAAFGTYVSPAISLGRPVTQVEATLAVERPPGSEVTLEVRGQGLDGRWTAWTEVEPDGGPAALDTAVRAVAYRLTLLADASGETGPRLLGGQLRLRADHYRLAALTEAPTGSPPTAKVWATREGLVGAYTANGHLIQPLDRFVALPSRRVLNPLGGTDYTVTLRYQGRTATVPVWDIGPWNIRDNYWDLNRELFADLPRWLPQAQAAYFHNHNLGRDQYGRFITLPTALDIADGTFWEDLGMPANDWVEVTFNWLDAPSPPPPLVPATILPKPTPTPAPRPKAESFAAPASAAPRLYLPVVLRGYSGWTSTLVVQNPNAVATAATVEFYSRDGTLLTAATVQIGPRGVGTLALASVDGLPARYVGPAIVTASQPVAVLVHQDHPDMDRMSYVGQLAGAATLYAPLVVKDVNGWDTIVHVQNTGTTPAEVQLTYYPVGGQGRTWTDTAVIPPLGARTFSQFNHPSLPAGFTGSAVISSPNGGQLAAVVNEVKNEGAAVSYPAPAAGGSPVLVPFVLRNYRGWSTGLQVQNLGSAPTTVNVTYQRLNGPGGGGETAVVPAGASTTFYQPANQQLPDDFLGTAYVTTSDGAPLAIVVSVINPQSTAAMSYLATAPTGVQLPLSFVARQAEGWSTSILVFNPQPAPLPIRVSYFDFEGRELAREEDTLPANGTRSFFQQRHPNLPDGFVGTAVVQSLTNQPVSAVVSAVYNP
jgi:hypothetical protein